MYICGYMNTIIMPKAIDLIYSPLSQQKIVILSVPYTTQAKNCLHN